MSLKQNIVLLIGCGFILAYAYGFSNNDASFEFQSQSLNPQDSSSGRDTSKTVGSDRYGDPISNPRSNSPFEYNSPNNVNVEVQPSRDLRTYTITETVGDSLEYRPESEMSFQEFAEYQRRQYIKEYWKKAAKTEAEQNRADEALNFAIKNSKGEPIVDIRPSGNVRLEFGGRWNRTENPAVPVRLQRNGGFEFDQQISLNLQGKIGERLNVAANWNTQATFDFDNNIKVSYEGREEDIIRDVQVGDVSMPINNSLIRGAQNLFGVKTQLQFGRLGVTTLFSRQRGTTETLIIQGGAQNRPIDRFASDYDQYRHYFLSHYFRKRFDDAYQRNPLNPNTGVTITRVEVWKTNLNNQTDENRNILAITDLGENGDQRHPSFTPAATPGGQPTVTDNEGYITNSSVIEGTTIFNPSNNSNNIFTEILADSNYRNDDLTASILEREGLSDDNDDFLVNQGAVRLEPGRDFTFHPELGFISLTSILNEGEALAVAFEYTLNGTAYKVGELTEDYAAVNTDQVIVLKMLKPKSLPTGTPLWDLMMKNIYSLNTNNVRQEGFQLRIIYEDDRTGVDNPSLQQGGPNIKDKPLLQLLGLDEFNLNRDKFSDGNFDFLENTTIQSERGRVILPKVEPFGRDLANIFRNANDPDSTALISFYTFPELYNNTQNFAKRQTQKDKFALKGSFQSASSTDIILPGINIAEGSVNITVGSVRLVEGRDFTVNYGINRVTITNEGILASGNDIKITYEKTDLFGFRNKSLLGTRLDYTISDDINIGATVLHLSEQPFVTRINVGDETVSNTQIGLDFKYADESRILTKMVDFLPVISTKEESNIALDLEVAALLPGNSRVLGESGTSYIDDFEGAETPFDFTRSPQTWRISSTPSSGLNVDDASSDSLPFGYHRAKLAWYTIDNTFFNDNTSEGFNIPEIEQGQAANHFVRAIIPQEIFPNQDLQQITLNTNTLDMAYFPSQRGPYNYNPDFTTESPRNNWAGMSRAITFDNDFDAGNVEYIEFWLMNPFQNKSGSNEPLVNDVLPGDVSPIPTAQQMGGDIYFNLGDVSEDLIRDGQHAFENGLPDNIETTEWGRVTTQQFITNAFDNNINRETQDVGLDGLSSGEENTFFGDFVSAVSDVEPDITEDPSSDNFLHYTRDDDEELGILERYIDFNGMENNSPVNDGATPFPRSNYVTPDNEDINNDRSVDFSEKYFEYKLDLDPVQLSDGTWGLDLDNNPFVVDQTIRNIEGNNNGDVRWYQVRIPIKTGFETVGNITNFQTIRFFRMFMTNFEQPIVLRMAQLQLVASQWRRVEEYDDDESGILGPGILPPIVPTEPASGIGGTLTLGTVNIEENASSTPGRSAYVLPPGIVRDFDQTTNIQRQLNEQSILVELEGLEDGYSGAVFRNVATDLINYGRIRLFIHGESDDPNTNDDDLRAFLRLGTDNNNNYYEIAVPLKLSNTENQDPEEVWLSDNEIDIALDDLIDVKLERDRNTEDNNIDRRYTTRRGKYYITVRGRPDRSTIRTFMLGATNVPFREDGRVEDEKSARLWFNELRVTDFDKRAGWAARANATAQLADLGNVNISGGYTSIGYGDIESKISQRERAETLEYGVSTNLAMDKFIPKKIISLPLYLSYDKTLITPQFNPLDPDVEVGDAIDNRGTEEGRDDLREKVVFKRTVRTAQLTSVKLLKTKPDAKKHFYDPHNITLSAGVTEKKETGIGGADNIRGNNVALFLDQTYRGSAAYNYSFKPLNIQPFKKLKFLNKKAFTLIKDINLNPIPSSVAVRGDLNRQYIKTQLYNSQLTTEGVTPTFEKRFTFDRVYNLRWNLTKSINVSYAATANALVDEPQGDREGTPGTTDPNFVQTEEEYRDSLRRSLARFGRLQNFNQTVTATYQIPINKFPLLDWVNTDVKYGAGYNWRAAPIGFDSLGNYANNMRDYTINGKLNMSKLYGKVPFLAKLEGAKRSRGRRPKSPTPKGNKDEEDDDKPKKELKGLKAIAGTLLMLKNVTVRYTLTEGTVLPGLTATPDLFGLQGGINGAPGLPFILGSQDLNNFKQNALANGWYTDANSMNLPITQTRREQIDVRASLEPIKAFRINATMSYSKGSNYSEIYRDTIGDPNVSQFIAFNPFLGGNVEMSYITLRTAFARDGSNNSNRNFTRFSEYRTIYQQRINQGSTTGLSVDANSQNVLIPAFIAAYSGRDVTGPESLSERDLQPTPRFPLPNWRVDYSGLSRIKSLRKKFSSINLTHSYSSKFAIGDFASSLLYQEIGINSGFITDVNRLQSDTATGAFIPNLIIGQITMNETFSPLIGINIRTRSKINLRLNYNKSRILTLNMSNAQLTEVNNNDIQIGIGYSKKEFSLKWLSFLPFVTPDMTLPNNITFKMDVSIRDTKTTQRSLSSETQEENNTVTNGQLNFQMRPNINYEYSRRLNVQIFFERTINEPRISSSFRRTGTAFGVRLLFSLT